MRENILNRSFVQIKEALDMKTDKLYIQNAAITVDKAMDIVLKVDSYLYQIIIYKYDGKWYPLEIGHFERKRKDVCEFCGERINFPDCEFLQENIDEVFEYIKKMPKVRLKILVN